MVKIIRIVSCFFVFLLVTPVAIQCSDQNQTLNQIMMNLVKNNKDKAVLAIFSIIGIFWYRHALGEIITKYFKSHSQPNNNQPVLLEDVNDNSDENILDISDDDVDENIENKNSTNDDEFEDFDKENLNLDFLFGEHPLCQYIICNNLCISKSDLRVMLQSEKIVVDDTMTQEQKILFESIMRSKDIFESEDESVFPLAFDDNTVFLPMALLIEYASNAIIFTDLDIADQFKNEMNRKEEVFKNYFQEEIFQREKIDYSKKRQLLKIFLHFFKEHLIKSENIRESLKVFTLFFNFPVFNAINMSESNNHYAFLYDMCRWYASQGQDFIEKNVSSVDKDMQEALVYFQYAFHLLQEGNDTLFYNYCLDELVDKIVSVDSDEKAIEILNHCFNHMFSYSSEELGKIFLQNKVRFFIFNRILMGESRWGGPIDVDSRYDYDETRAPWHKLFIENVYDLLVKQKIDNDFWREYTDFWFNYCFPYHVKNNNWKLVNQQTIHELVVEKIPLKNLNKTDLEINFEQYRNNGYVFSKFLSEEITLSWSDIDYVFFENKEKKINKVAVDNIKYHKLISFKKWSELLSFAPKIYGSVLNCETEIGLPQEVQNEINNLIEEIKQTKIKKRDIDCKICNYPCEPKEDTKCYEEKLDLAKSNLEAARLYNGDVVRYEKQIELLTESIKKLNEENEKTQAQRDKRNELALQSKNLNDQLENLVCRLNILAHQCFISHIFFSVPSGDQVKIASNLLFDNNVFIKNIDTSLHRVLLENQLEKEKKNFDMLRNVLRERIRSKNSKNLLHDLVGDIIKTRGQNYSFNYIALNLSYLFSDEQKTLNQLIKKAKKLHNFIQDSDVKKMLKDVIWELSIYLDNKFENKQYTSMRDFILYQSESTTEKLNESSKNVIEKIENYIINIIFSDNDDICNEKQKVKLLLYGTYHKAIYEKIKNKKLEMINYPNSIKVYYNFMFKHQKNGIEALNLKHEELFSKSKLTFEKNCPYAIFNPTMPLVDLSNDIAPVSIKGGSKLACEKYETQNYFSLHLLGKENDFVKDLLSLKN